jgi:peptide-methionine (S)-S-oxide reductase
MSCIRLEAGSPASADLTGKGKHITSRKVERARTFLIEGTPEILSSPPASNRIHVGCYDLVASDTGEFVIFSPRNTSLVRPEEILPGRPERIPAPESHFILKTPMEPPFPGMELAMFAMGCFWGAEKKFWEAAGVHSTAAGYAAGSTPNPRYEEVCSGLTNHAEMVRIAFDPSKTSYEAMLKVFWESHDPTQGMRQGADHGTQYRSGIYWYGEAQRAAAEASRREYQILLSKAGHGEITTEILQAPEFYNAEEHHQQYLAKNPAGYCGSGGTGVSCPMGVVRK